MPTGLPSVITTLASSGAPPSITDTANVPLIIGPCTAGTVDLPATLAQLSDCAAFGNGPGIEAAAEVGQAAGWPVYFVRSTTTTASAASDLYKVQASGVGAAVPVYGQIILPGANANGSVAIHSLVAGVTLTVVQGMSAAFTAVGLDVTLTVVAATTTANDIVALSLAAVSTLIATPTKPGSSNNGTALCDSAVAVQSFDNGKISYTARVGAAAIVAGADANGGVVYMTDLSDVKVVQHVSGNSTALRVYVDPTTPNVIHLVSATDSGGLATTTAAAAATAIAANADAMALLNAGVGVTYTGTGAGLVAAASSTTLVPVTVRQVSSASNNNTLAVTTPTGAAQVSISLGADSAGRDSSTATATVAAIVASTIANQLVSASAGGTGAGKAGPATYQTMNWGGASACTLSGTPVDRFYDLGIRVSLGGSLGATPAPTVQWTVDGVNWSSQTVVPSTGIVALTDALLTSGLTATFTGTLVADEAWYGATTAPQSGSADLQSALTAAISDTTRAWGFASTPCSVSRATMVALDSLVQAALQTRFLASVWGSRDIGEGVPGETEAEWMASVIGDVQGFDSSKGLSAFFAEPVLVTSPLTRRQYRRNGAYAAAARKASVPIHENLGKVKTGTLHNVLGIYHDESKVPGFATQRIGATMTYPSRPGSYYFWGAPTMCDSVADPGYVFCEYVAVALSAARACHDTVEVELNDSLPGTNVTEAGNVPVGALTQQAASDIQSKAEFAVRTLIMKAKSDGKASASGPGLDDDGNALTSFVQVSRHNNYLADRTIYVNVNVLPLGLTQTIRDTITIQIPT